MYTFKKPMMIDLFKFLDTVFKKRYRLCFL